MSAFKTHALRVLFLTGGALLCVALISAAVTFFLVQTTYFKGNTAVDNTPKKAQNE